MTEAMYIARLASVGECPTGRVRLRNWLCFSVIEEEIEDAYGALRWARRAEPICITDRLFP